MIQRQTSTTTIDRKRQVTIAYTRHTFCRSQLAYAQVIPRLSQIYHSPQRKSPPYME